MLASLASTPWAAGALGDMHDHGYTLEAFDTLQASHLVRSLTITMAAVWALVEGWRTPDRA